MVLLKRVIHACSFPLPEYHQDFSVLNYIMKYHKHKKQKNPQTIVSGIKLDFPLTSAQRSQLQSAVTLHQQGHLVEAEAIYKLILQVQPSHFDVLQYLALAALQRKNFTDAVVYFKRALSLNPHHLPSLNNYGLALLALKRFDEALECYEKAIDVSADSAEAFCNRGVTLQELTRYDEALVSYERAIALNEGYVISD